MNTLHLVVPDSIDDPRRPSGGNTYDRRLHDGLGARGWEVRRHAATGTWPWPDGPARQALAHRIAAVPDGDVLLVDGLIASTAPDVLVPAARRVRLAVLVHMPFDDAVEGAESTARERAVLSAARVVITTSAWGRERVLSRCSLDPDRVLVAEPGADPSCPAPGTATGGELLCVGAVTAQKGHDILIAALERIADLSWHCVCVGPVADGSAFVRSVRHRITDGLRGRVRLVGPRAGADLDRFYDAADLLVHVSRREAYGMVITEALAHGVPVVAADVGGVAQALGRVPGGRPGVLVPPDDPRALADALGQWLQDASTRTQLRAAARERRATLPRWDATVDQVGRALAEATR